MYKDLSVSQNKTKYILNTDQACLYHFQKRDIYLQFEWSDTVHKNVIILQIRFKDCLFIFYIGPYFSFFRYCLVNVPKIVFIFKITKLKILHLQQKKTLKN